MNKSEPEEMRFFEKAHFYFNFSLLVMGLALSALFAGIYDWFLGLWGKFK
jgi:hypothetical protein